MRFHRVRGLFVRRYREDVRFNWNTVSILMWILYLLLFAHWCVLTARSHASHLSPRALPTLAAREPYHARPSHATVDVSFAGPVSLGRGWARETS